MAAMDWYEWVPFFLLAIGGLNWGLVGLFDFNLVSWATSAVPLIEKVVYVLVGLSGGYALFFGISSLLR